MAIHDGQGRAGLGDHHAPLAFFLTSEPLGLEYASAEAPYASRPNATDKVFLPHGVHGAVGAAGVCMSDEWVVHLRFGTEAPGMVLPRCRRGIRGSLPADSQRLRPQDFG